MAMTAAERAARYRENQRAQGDAERINTFAKADTIKRIRLYSDYYNMSQSEALDAMVAALWATISEEEKSKMDAHAVELEEKRRQRKAGDTLTGDLFS